MDQKLAAVKKEALVQMIKLVQKRGMRGNKGGWKEFLNFYDKKIGASLSDPARRPVESLVAFLKTFDQEDDLKFLEKILECHSNRDAVEQFQKTSLDSETPEQTLVRSTMEHHRYPIEYSFPSHEEGWLIMKRSKKPKFFKSTAMVAVDCEMVLCQDGTEALVRVCIVDRHLQVKLDELVNPNKAIADYRTEITGISAEDLEGVTHTLLDVQKSLKKLLSHGTILVGHSLSNDLRALKVDHPRVIDTSYVFKYENNRPGQRPSLYNLCKSVLGFELRQNGSPHNCVDDAVAAMKLVLAIVENGVERVIPESIVELQEMDLSKLLLHRIPINIPSNMLHSIIPGDYTIEVKEKKHKAEKYSAFAIFKSQHEADVAFSNLEGFRNKDSHGRPQKIVSFNCGSGFTGQLCIRKMFDGESLNQTMLTKRSAQAEVGLSPSKRSKMTQAISELEETSAGSCTCEDHQKEIARLCRELSERDTKIAELNKLLQARDTSLTELNKLLVAMTRKQGL